MQKQKKLQEILTIMRDLPCLLQSWMRWNQRQLRFLIRLSRRRPCHPPGGQSPLLGRPFNLQSYTVPNLMS